MTAPIGPVNEGTGPSPRAGRYTTMVRALQVALGVTFALATAELAAPASIRSALGIAMVAVLILVPLLRVLWLVIRWFRSGDVKFGLVGVALLIIVTLGLLLSH